ncbi:hypothetical protein SO802_024021 [Lithocarpus litseifolius]|uniref:Uncharacterized protein n=1 Tax=Lithocarpus litseifolius TaxID=425828 RepID=A0AAW2C9D1_9ROSI
MSAICAERDCVLHEDFMKVVWKLNEAKRFKSSAHYSTDFGWFREGKGVVGRQIKEGLFDLTAKGNIK